MAAFKEVWYGKDPIHSHTQEIHVINATAIFKALGAPDSDSPQNSDSDRSPSLTLGEFLPLWASVSSSVKRVNLIPVQLCLATRAAAGGNAVQDVTVSLATFHDWRV